MFYRDKRETRHTANLDALANLVENLQIKKLIVPFPHEALPNSAGEQIRADHRQIRNESLDQLSPSRCRMQIEETLNRIEIHAARSAYMFSSRIAKAA
jgi:hypothetical protein